MNFQLNERMINVFFSSFLYLKQLWFLSRAGGGMHMNNVSVLQRLADRFFSLIMLAEIYGKIMENTMTPENP